MKSAETFPLQPPQPNTGNDSFIPTDIQAQSEVGIWECDVESQRVSWSRGMYAIHGLDGETPTTVLPAMVEFSLSCYAPKDRCNVASLFERCVERGEPYDIECGFTNRLGQHLWVRTLAHALIENGKVTKVIGCLVDLTQRKQVEEALQAENLRRNILMNASRDGIAVFNQDHEVVESNRRFAAMLGYSPEEVRKLHTWDFEACLKEAEIRANFKDLSQTDAVFETKHRRKDGTTYDAEVCACGALALGEPLVLTITRDISDRKSAEDALRQSEEKFRLVFQNSPDPILICRLDDCQILDVNHAFCDSAGYQKHEVLGRRIQELNPWSDPHDQDRLVLELENSGKVTNLETVLVCKNGKTTPVLMSATILPLGGEKHLYISARVIEDQKRAEEKLRDSEERNRQILQTAIDGFCRIDTRGRILEVNQAYCRITGYDARELLGMSIADLEGVMTVGDIEALLCSIIEKGAARFESRQRRKDGSIFDVEVSAQTIKNKEGLQLVSFTRDISERKLMEKEKELVEARLRQSQRMEAVGTLAAGIAHDFNNILFPIMGLSEMLLEDLPNSSPERENAEQILTATLRASKLVKRILAFSRQSELIKMPVRLQHVLKEVIRLARSTIPANIDIQTVIQEDCAMVLADSGQLHQVAMNLITNAFHAVESCGGTIAITLREVVVTGKEQHLSALTPGAYALFKVSDTGHGIDPAVKEKIFEPYFTTKDQGKGTGLGLFLVYGIVKEHGGHIHVESEIGKGATFEIYLPEFKSAVPVEEYQLDSPVTTGSERILLVDDEAGITRMQQISLERLGYRVTVRTSSLEALGAFRANPHAFDLVITDMAMPQMTGEELARQIMQIRPGIPVILCTGFSAHIDQQRARAMGICGFVMKPVLIKDLAVQIRRVLDASDKPPAG